MKIKTVFLIILCGIIVLSCRNRREIENVPEGSIILQFELTNDYLEQIEDNFTLELNQEEKIAEQIEPQHRHNRFPVSIEFDLEPGFMIFSGRNMILRTEIIYASESCQILNYYEVLNVDVNDVLDRPILNKNIFLPSTVRTNYRAFFDCIEELLNIFGVSLLQADVDKFNETQAWRSSRITLEYMYLYITRTFSGSFRLWMIEYNKPSSLYDFNVKIGTEKSEIISRFGFPIYYSEEGDIFDYWAHGTLRSMIILFENEKVARVQLTASDGI